jgi:Actinobacteria/chloroflexi VLRF1 release factor
VAYAGQCDPAAFAQACVPPRRWGVLLVRKGGFAIARLAGERIAESKVGQRHVQGRTKAGGQSQQRFSRRRDNQARAAYEAAAGHADRILTGPLTALVCGGDRTAVEQVLEDPRLHHLAGVRVDPWLAVPDPRRAVLEQAVADACSITVEVTNA